MVQKCYNLGFKYLFYNPGSGIYMLSEREPVFYNMTFMYCDGKKHPFSSYFSTLVAEDLLDGGNYIAIEDHIDIVDWSKVPVDTPILVKDNYEDCWHKRYFAKYENGVVFAFSYGSTQWSNDGDTPIHYDEAKLVEDTNK